MSLVDDYWVRVGHFLERLNLRRTALREPVGDQQLAEVERELGVAFPDELRSWWSIEDVLANYWLPPEFFAPLSFRDALETREIWLTVSAQEDGELGSASSFGPELFPVGMNPEGDGLIVSLGPGDDYGMIFRWQHERAERGQPLWRGIGHMLADIAQAMDEGSPVLRWHADRGGEDGTRVLEVDSEGQMEWVLTGEQSHPHY